MNPEIPSLGMAQIRGMLQERFQLKPVYETDFGLLRTTVERLSDKELSEQFDQEKFDFSPENGFWVSVRDTSMSIVSVQAARVENLGTKTLAEHWETQLPRVYLNRLAGDALFDQMCPAPKKITKQVVNHGEMWLAEEYRKQGIAGPICRYGQLLAYLKWNPDYIYGWMEEGLARRGFAYRQGYFRTHPIGTNWRIDPPVRKHDAIVWNSRSDLEYLALVESGALS